MPLILWFQEFKIKVKTGAFFLHVLVVCRPRGTPGFFRGILSTRCIPQNMQRVSSFLIGCILYSMGFDWLIFPAERSIEEPATGQNFHSEKSTVNN